MPYGALILDFDGTLRPGHLPRITRPVADALLAVQRSGVRLALATGRSRAAITSHALRGVKPDGWICGNGAQVLDGRDATLQYTPLSAEAMYALTDWCENYEYPLAFAFPDGYYAYVEYQVMADTYAAITGSSSEIRDGEDQDHHLEQMPFAAFCIMPPAAREAFNQSYPHLGFRFLPYSRNACDVVTPGQDKQAGVRLWLQSVGLDPAQTVAAGDGYNDVEMIRAAGFGVAMANAPEPVRQAADWVCPPDTEDGVVSLCRRLFPRAFADG